MKVIIAGSRYYPGYFKSEHLAILEKFKVELPITTVIAGGCRGVDKNAIIWAKNNNLPFIEMAADWDHYGKAAGPMRNHEMAKLANAVILFPGGLGTANMFLIAKSKNLPIFTIEEN